MLGLSYCERQVVLVLTGQGITLGLNGAPTTQDAQWHHSSEHTNPFDASLKVDAPEA